jgi:hypothetical protein
MGYPNFQGAGSQTGEGEAEVDVWWRGRCRWQTETHAERARKKAGSSLFVCLAFLFTSFVLTNY